MAKELTNEEMLRVIRSNQQGIIDCDRRLAELEKVKITLDPNDFKQFRSCLFVTGGKVDEFFIDSEISIQVLVKQCLEDQIEKYKEILEMRNKNESY